MANQLNIQDDTLGLRYFQAYQLFNRDQLDAVLNQPQWAAKYPEVVKDWKSGDKLVSSRVFLPAEIILTLAREADCVGDLYADADGQTLHMVTPGTTPFRFFKDANGKTVVEDIPGATKLSTEQALRDYGADAVWLAQEYGKSRRGERDTRFQGKLPVSS